MEVSGFYHNTQIRGRSAGDTAKTDIAKTFTDALSSAVGSSKGSDEAEALAPDFTRMTRKGLADWVNEQIKSGKMSVDESSIFVSMTGHVAVSGGYQGLDDTAQVNFMQSAQEGMVWARQHNDAELLDRLQAALTTMQRYQAGDVGGGEDSVQKVQPDGFNSMTKRDFVAWGKDQFAKRNITLDELFQVQSAGGDFDGSVNTDFSPQTS